MIVLSATTDNLQVVLAGNVTANQLQCFSSWRDITTTAYTAGRTVINTNNTTDVNIVGAPDASTQRVVDFISIYNADTANATVTIKLDANGTEYVLCKVVLSTLERLEYIDGQGFKIFTSAGAVKSSINQGNNPTTSSLSTTVLGGDITNNNASANTMADVTGLSFSVASGHKYYFWFIIPYTSAATTTGSRWSINGPANDFLYFTSTYTLTATTNTINFCSAYDTPAASNATSLATGTVCYLQGILNATANGSVIARFASEVSNSAIVAKAGAVVYSQQIT